MRDPNTDPKAQLADASKISSAPVGLPTRLLPVLSSTMPTNPSAMPAHSSLVLRMPHNRLKQRVNSGTVATITAAMPDGTCWCSATVTRPLPTASSRMPMAPAASHCFGVVSAWPRQARKLNSTMPASRKRIPAIISGGHCSTPRRMTK
ncbi:hypothetical protein RF55_21917 [Lasius niger]|uniref:Uncharacterized protein n=1 Tax=Lasius niger TaxID=67767 RepID=A0A0J7MQC9_LASNI|nr:hypothetical protein RF55_21917 [Lasius niger]